MSKERPQPSEPYGFTESEKLWDRISHQRLEAMIGSEKTNIHRLELDSNQYGEFLFITTSQGEGDRQSAITFFGLGYHEYRDRWLTDEWFWYETSLPRGNMSLVPKAEALETIHQRREEVLGYAKNAQQSSRGKLFDIIADLTDEDGALAEIEDFGGGLDDEIDK